MEGPHRRFHGVYRWCEEDDNPIQLFPITATITIRGLPLHHWNRCDLSKVVARFAHLLDIDEATANKTELAVARVRIGCENIESVPRELTIVVGNQRRKLTVNIIGRIGLPSGP